MSSAHYQYSSDWIVGREGDVWTKCRDRLSILGDPNQYGFTLGERRDQYVHISNLPPIKYIVDIVSGLIVMVTRGHSLLIVTANNSKYEVIPNIVDAFRLQQGQYNVLIYLARNENSDPSNLRMFSYHRYSLTADNFENSIPVVVDPTVIPKIEGIYPMRLSPQAQYVSALDSILIKYNDGYRIMSLIDYQLKSVHYSHPVHNLVKVNFNSIVADNGIIRLTLDTYSEGGRITPIGSYVDTAAIQDANYITSISIQNQLVILRDNRILNDRNEVLMSGVDRFINFLHNARGLMISGLDEKTYHVMIGSTSVTKRIKDLNIPVVLA